MLQALEGIPGPGLAVLLVAAVLAGWWLCRGVDRFLWWARDARDGALNGADAFAAFLGRLVKLALMGCGLLFLIGVLYQSTH